MRTLSHTCQKSLVGIRLALLIRSLRKACMLLYVSNNSLQTMCLVRFQRYFEALAIHLRWISMDLISKVASNLLFPCALQNTY